MNQDGRAGWSEMAADYDRTRAFPGDGETIVPQALARLLGTLAAARVLDLGCGTGRFALPLAREGLRVVAADRSPEMLAILAAKRQAERISVVRCDAEALPFSRAFDAVVISHFLHLVPSLARLAEQLQRALLPGAHLVLVDTSTGRVPADLRVLEIVMPLLGAEFRPWPSGDDSHGRLLLRELLGHLAAAETSVGSTMSFPFAKSLRETLADVRERTWWTCRVHPEADVLRAADEAERRLVAEGADLDAPIDSPVEVRFVVGQIP